MGSASSGKVQQMSLKNDIYPRKMTGEKHNGDDKHLRPAREDESGLQTKLTYICERKEERDRICE